MKTLSPTMQDATLEHPYILDRKHTAAGQIVLAYTGHHNYEPYVTWAVDPSEPREPHAFYGGHYYAKRSGADWDFQHRNT